jgi:peptide/nickel transport system permease protein
MANVKVAPSLVTRLETKKRSASFWESAFRSVLRDRLTIAAIFILVIMTLVCILAPPVVENVLQVDSERTNVLDRFLLPGIKGHVLGTDQVGRDQFVRLLYGGRVSLAIAYFGSVAGIAIGVTFGLIAGYFGGLIDDIVSWFINTLSSIPAIFLLILAAAIWSPSPTILVVLLAAFGWITTCRLVRAEVLSLKQRDFITAVRAMGAGHWHIIALHLFPNVLSLIIVSLTIDAGTLILTESGLSFLGLGVQPPTPSWGNMLTDARTFLVKGVHLIVWPGVLITFTVLCFYIVGDGLRDALDPHTSRKS